MILNYPRIDSKVTDEVLAYLMDELVDAGLIVTHEKGHSGDFYLRYPSIPPLLGQIRKKHPQPFSPSHNQIPSVLRLM